MKFLISVLVFVQMGIFLTCPLVTYAQNVSEKTDHHSQQESTYMSQEQPVMDCCETKTSHQDTAGIFQSVVIPLLLANKNNFVLTPSTEPEQKTGHQFIQVQSSDFERRSLSKRE